MATTSTNSVQITNQLNIAITVYDTTSTEAPSNPPSTNPEDYYPVYTKIATVPANSTQAVPVSETLARLVLTRADNDFPICVYVPPIMGGGTVQIANQDLTPCQTAWSFYQAYVSQPYAPVSLQFTELLLNNPNPLTLNDQISSFLGQNGYPNCDYLDFSIVSYWATNSLQAWPNTYYCYEPSNNTSGFVMPTTQTGQIVIANGTANFTPANGGSSLALTFSDSILSSSGATSSTGLSLTGILRSLSWEGQPSQQAMCFSGKYNGTDFIAQPYQNPSLPWWAAAYDMTFATFLGVQIAMTVDMAVHVLSGVANGVQYLASKMSDFVSSVRSKFEDIGADADPVASMGDPVDPINVDVDVDVDNVVDTVDVTDVDTDVDIDTDVNVETGTITSVLNKLGSWIMTKGFPALVKNLAIMAAFQGAQTLLNVWKKSAEQELSNLSPQQTTGLGLLVNYMLNSNNTVQVRWMTFADWIQQVNPDNNSQQTTLASILMTKNTAADQAMSAWRWSSSDENAAVQAMTKASNAYLAYQALASYSYNNQPLPVKVACSVAMKYCGGSSSTPTTATTQKTLSTV